MTDQITQQQAPDVNQIAPLNEAGVFDFMQRQAKLYAASQIIPKQYQNNMPNCYIALDMARRLGANPMIVMQNLYIVHGSPAWSSQFLIGMVNSSKRFTPLKFKFNKDKTECYAYCKDIESDEILEGSTVSIALAKAEGWYDRKDKQGNFVSKWRTMPEQMLMYRAAGFFTRVYCPEATMGIRSQDEVIDIAGMEVVEEVASPELDGEMPADLDVPAANADAVAPVVEAEPEPKKEPAKKRAAKKTAKAKPEIVVEPEVIVEEPKEPTEEKEEEKAPVQEEAPLEEAAESEDPPRGKHWKALINRCEEDDVSLFQVSQFLKTKNHDMNNETMGADGKTTKGEASRALVLDKWDKLVPLMKKLPKE